MCCKIFSSTLEDNVRENRRNRGENGIHSTKIVRVGDKEVLLALCQELVENARVEKSIVEIAVTRGIPVLLVIIGTLGAGKEGFLENPGVARLIEGGDAELLVCVFLDDTEGVLVCVE